MIPGGMDLPQAGGGKGIGSVGEVPEQADVLTVRQLSYDDMERRTKSFLGFIGEVFNLPTERGDWIQQEDRILVTLPQQPEPCSRRHNNRRVIHESLHLYVGGLGILAGDHGRSTSMGSISSRCPALGMTFMHGYGKLAQEKHESIGISYNVNRILNFYEIQQ
jgi:hypothetical protein